MWNRGWPLGTPASLAVALAESATRRYRGGGRAVAAVREIGFVSRRRLVGSDRVCTAGRAGCVMPCLVDPCVHFDADQVNLCGACLL